MPSIEPEKTAYRAEIDGLRAFAVLSVVSYHAFPAGLPGGFTGVDVFFVISGYLITAHIFTSLDEDKFSFLDFFQRRIRRIFPALILVMVSSLIFGWFALISEELQQLGKHLFSGAAFIVNFVLVSESGYFDTAADTKPMLHLWSLAVEEQFYIFWPVVLWLAWRQHFNLIWITLLVAVASFCFNMRFVTPNPTEVFFWPFGRFWELLSGSILAWLTLYKRDALDLARKRIDTCIARIVPFSVERGKIAFTENIMALGGLCLLIYGFAEISSNAPFPSTWALVPVCGTLLTIAAGAAAWSNRIFMMNPVAVWFGLISYPLYLWHWPILSFLQIVESGEPPHRDARIVAVVLAILLAWLTVRFVEKPLRFGHRNAHLKTVGLTGTMILVGAAGLLISRTDLSESHTLEKLLVERPGAEHIYGRSSRWYQGQEDWLFLGNAFDDTVAKLKLASPPDPANIEQETTLFANLAEAAETAGSRVALLISPNKSTIYPEYLPVGIEPSERRYVSYFSERLDAIANLTVVDPTEDLLRTKQSAGLLYYRTDTHWNDKGAFRAFSVLADRIGLPVPEVSFKASTPYSGDLVGISDLAGFPVTAGDNWQIEWASQPDLESLPLEHQPETSFGRTEIVMNNAPLSEQTVWVIGDSFTNSVAPYINAAFQEVHYRGHWNSKLRTLPQDLTTAKEKPDLIIVIRVERSF
ncbi:acyltransferase family protein [uncultured Roseobacter sp.]|uniref:acyltransferase family protein n=1 Tax=uncultured Roseobacter sp. TaxID=114847 RepID=UPI002615C229|nr:acyltransferase family protein [uncultured Roseobacter sp.]